MFIQNRKLHMNCLKIIYQIIRIVKITYELFENYISNGKTNSQNKRLNNQYKINKIVNLNV